MKIILALILMISLTWVAADHFSNKTVSDKSTTEIKLDENIEISDADTIEIRLDESIEMSDGSILKIKLDENMEISDADTIEIRLDEGMEKPGKVKERVMNNPNYLMNQKECKKVKDVVAGILSMSDGVWKEIEKNPEDKEKWAEVIALSSLTSNYSNVYDVWCKGLAHHRIKNMKIKTKNQINNKDGKDKED